MRMRLDQLIKPEIETLLENCNFTDEELEIFKLKCKGKSMNEISWEVGLSTTTISRRTRSIEKKIEKSKQ